jgi:Domain of unknown function (DUF4129)
VAALAAAALLGAPPGARAQTAPDPSAARSQARQILHERRFRGTDVPRPFAGLLRKLGDRLQPIADFFDRLTLGVGRGFAFTLLAVLVLLVALVVARGSIRRRTASEARAARARAPGRDDPDALERDADRAAAQGEWETAVRLRFRAGLLRLDARELIEYRASLTTGEVADTVRLPAFERVGADFDEIAYGGRPAQQADDAASREGWERVLTEAGR